MGKKENETGKPLGKMENETHTERAFIHMSEKTSQCIFRLHVGQRYAEVRRGTQLRWRARAVLIAVTHTYIERYVTE